MERRETRRKDKSYKPEAASCKLCQQPLLVFSCNKSLFELQITNNTVSFLKQFSNNLTSFPEHGYPGGACRL